MRIHEIENWKNKELTRDEWVGDYVYLDDEKGWRFCSVYEDEPLRYVIDDFITETDWKEYKKPKPIPKTITLHRHTFNFSGKYWQSDWTTIKRDIGHKMIGGEIVVHRESKEVTI